MSKTGTRFGDSVVSVLQYPQDLGKGHAAQRHDHLDTIEKVEFCFQPATACFLLRWDWLVAGWRTSHNGADKRIREHEAVTPCNSFRLAGESGPVKRSEQPIPGSIAGEHTAGAVGTMRSRRQPDDEKSGSPISKTGNWFRPIVPVAIGGPLFVTYLLSPGDEPWTPPTVDYVLFESDYPHSQRVHGAAQATR